MIANVEVNKNKGESTSSLLRRFTRKVQSMRLVKNTRAKRYARRDLSPAVRRKQKLKKLEKTKRYEQLRKLGKI